LTLSHATQVVAKTMTAPAVGKK